MNYVTLLSAMLLPLTMQAAANTVVPESSAPAFQQFFQQLSAQCGKAYPGKLTLEPEGDDMLTGTELLIVHFRECSDTQLKVPFHIELEATEDWNRSRTWIFTKHADKLELRHDHRTKEGDDDKVTMYGGFSYGAGNAIRQEFQSLERTAESGYFRGWRIEIEPGVRYTYGTVRGSEWSWRIDFDLSQPLTELPPAPWGHQ